MVLVMNIVKIKIHQLQLQNEIWNARPSGFGAYLRLRGHKTLKIRRFFLTQLVA